VGIPFEDMFGDTVEIMFVQIEASLSDADESASTEILANSPSGSEDLFNGAEV
jgi:hypothetical protein